MKAIIIIGLLLVLAALASAGVFMLRKDTDDGQQRDKKMARALAVRVGLSVALFLFILLSWYFGWIEPRGIPVTR
ncbi:twin transmembrane helix small protein [Ideonella sp. BN130291]|uniref:twin transmembrane helix small protein n=1 Tax=Ideonella sp. BN130291 TaxID=3112940 RepID=UPI002E269AD8|nr:twin transmembrane helix small protein [Ideonella sp. BN130291]